MKRLTESEYFELIEVVKNGEYENYNEQHQRHRTPAILAEQFLRELSERFVALQSKSQLSQIVPEINKIFESGKNLKSYFVAIQEYCKRNKMNFNVTAKLIAEYNGMDDAYRIISVENSMHRNSKQGETALNDIELLNIKNKDFTTARQVLAMHFIFEFMQLRNHEIDKTSKARFIEFMTGKNYQNIYALVLSPFITKAKEFRSNDLQFIRSYFENLGLGEIVRMIDNQLERPK